LPGIFIKSGSQQTGELALKPNVPSFFSKTPADTCRAPSPCE
jgi:hypothetical protein